MKGKGESTRAAGTGLRVMIAGGGTGGHLFPGIALAEEVKARGGEVVFVGTQRGIEARVLPEQGWPLELIEVSGIKGRGVRGLLTGLLRLPRAWWQSRAILRRVRPDVVIGVGGYASGPIVATASMMRIPTAIMEQNSIPGITNRILARLVRRIFTSFDDLRGHFPKHKIVHAGNPIRRALLERLQAGDDAGVDSGRGSARLFVFGGSQGARAINEQMLAAAPGLMQALPGLEIWHQTGRAEHERVQQGYRALGLEQVRVDGFINDMASAYRWADLVLCRAGATSVAELAAVGRPAVLVPFPHATDNHQEFNAQALVERGAAVLQRQSEWSTEGLSDTLLSLLGDRGRLAKMRSAMLDAARPDAAARIFEELAALRR